MASGWRQNINPNQMLPHFVSKSTKLSITKWGTKFSTVANIRKCCVSIRCQLCFQGVLMVAMPEIRVSWKCCFLSYDFLTNLGYRIALLNVWLNEEIQSIRDKLLCRNITDITLMDWPISTKRNKKDNIGRIYTLKRRRRLEEYAANSFLLSLMLPEKTMTFVKCVSQTYLFPDV